ncbi:MAG TPA: hypothetical protein PLN34_01235 [Alloprevotella sp.]|nr:hypothetical protein [Alloprevotella sp.]
MEARCARDGYGNCVRMALTISWASRQRRAKFTHRRSLSRETDKGLNSSVEQHRIQRMARSRQETALNPS